jgi:hypothetical protein
LYRLQAAQLAEATLALKEVKFVGLLLRAAQAPKNVLLGQVIGNHVVANYSH